MIIVYLLIIVNSCTAYYNQDFQYSACVLLDVNYTGSVKMYKTLSTDSFTSLKHNLEEEDFITFKIKNKNDTMYYVEANYEIEGYIGKGWIKKTDHIKIFARNYTGELILYSKATIDSSIIHKIKEYLPYAYDVIDCRGKWLKIRVRHRFKIYEGWIEPSMQCCNPYSTCG